MKWLSCVVVNMQAAALVILWLATGKNSAMGSRSICTKHVHQWTHLHDEQELQQHVHSWLTICLRILVSLAKSVNRVVLNGTVLQDVTAIHPHQSPASITNDE